MKLMAFQLEVAAAKQDTDAYEKAALALYFEETRIEDAKRLAAGLIKGCCKYCANSKQYKEDDVWMNNHITSDCPRLALVQCSECRQRGHNASHCPLKAKPPPVELAHPMLGMAFVFTSLPKMSVNKSKGTTTMSANIRILKRKSSNNSDRPIIPRRRPRSLKQMTQEEIEKWEEMTQFILDFEQFEEKKDVPVTMQFTFGPIK